jgi:hypothetical protein
MNEPKKRFPDSFVAALSREEWEQDHRAGLDPNETYEAYLDALRRDYFSVSVPPESR